MTRISLPVALLACTLAGGCVTGGAGAGGTRSDREVITSEEIREYEGQYENAYRLVQMRRAMWLNPRGTATLASPEPPLPRVVLDGSPYGEIEALASLRLTEIEELRFMHASDATTRFGTGYPGGAILVRTR